MSIIDRVLADIDELRGETHAENFSADDARINDALAHSGYPHEGLQTVYVRPDGDDDASGLTEDDAVASLSEGFKRLPRLPAYDDVAGNQATIYIADGTYTIDSRINVAFPWLSGVVVSGNPRATIQIEDGVTAFGILRTNLALQNVDVEPADPANPHDALAQVLDRSKLQLEGETTVTGGVGGRSDALISCFRASELVIGDNVVVDGDGDATNGVSAHSSSHITLNNPGTVVEGFTNIGVYVDRNATADTMDTTIRADADAVGTNGLRVEDGASVKVNDTTFEECSTAVLVQYGGVVQEVVNAATFTNCGVTWRPREGGTVILSDGTALHGGPMKFYDTAGNAVAELDEAGNLTLEGTLTESGSVSE